MAESGQRRGEISREPADLSRARLGNFRRTEGRHIEALWMLAEFFFVYNPLQVSSRVRRFVLRIFGARIGKNVILRPRLRVKFPWNMSIGDNCWIGEGVWIHNQAPVMIEENVVLSQESFITTGSHDIHGSMDLVVEPVNIHRGAWVTTRCIVLRGVHIGENAIVTPGSVVHKSLPPDCIYGGNPAKFIRKRWKDAP